MKVYIWIDSSNICFFFVFQISGKNCPNLQLTKEHHYKSNNHTAQQINVFNFFFFLTNIHYNYNILISLIYLDKFCWLKLVMLLNCISFLTLYMLNFSHEIAGEISYIEAFEIVSIDTNFLILGKWHCNTTTFSFSSYKFQCVMYKLILTYFNTFYDYTDVGNYWIQWYSTRMI